MRFLNDFTILLFMIVMFYIANEIFKHFILPWLINKGTKIVDKNPKWITSKLYSEYYGIQDIDILLVETTNVFSEVPRFRKTNNGKFELLIPNDISTNDVEIIGQMALTGKIALKYGLFYTNKPAFWLSILCYMLDGGDIKEENTKLEQSNIIPPKI